MAPKPPNARRAPAQPWRFSVPRSLIRGPDMAPKPPNAPSAPGAAVALLGPPLSCRFQPFVAHSLPLVRLAWTLRAPLGIVSASRPLPAWGHPMEDRPIEARRANVSVLGLLLGTGPRFARDAVGP